MRHAEDFEDDREDPLDDDDSEADDDTFETVPCPYCRQQIHEDTVRCPHCENYISAVDSPRLKRPPWWIIVGLVLCLIIVYYWVTRG